VFATRRASASAVAVVHARRRSDARPSRVTVVAGKALGAAVTRNRAKRRLRAALRAVSVPPGMDLVVVARDGALTADFSVLCERLAAQLERLEAGR